MTLWYLIVPLLNLTVFLLLLRLLWGAHRSGAKMKRNVLIAVLAGFLLIGGFFSWRFTDLAIYPHLTDTVSALSLQGHRYIRDNSFSDGDVPPFSGLKKVAYEERDLFNNIFFPTRIYEDKKDPRTLWEIGLMWYGKFDRID